MTTMTRNEVRIAEEKGDFMYEILEERLQHHLSHRFTKRFTGIKEKEIFFLMGNDVNWRSGKRKYQVRGEEKVTKKRVYFYPKRFRPFGRRCIPWCHVYILRSKVNNRVVMYGKVYVFLVNVKIHYTETNSVKRIGYVDVLGSLKCIKEDYMSGTMVEIA